MAATKAALTHPVAHHYRDAVLTTILGGTTEMPKLTIGRELLAMHWFRVNSRFHLLRWSNSVS
jgi:hypothetical protein